MEFGILLLIIIYILYLLLIKGMLWKIIIAVFGWFGMYVALETYIVDSKFTCIIFMNYNLSWSEVIPSAIVLLAMLYTKDE